MPKYFPNRSSMAGRPGRRPRMTRRVASKSVALRRPRFVRRRRYPARFANSKATYNLNRRVSAIMNKMSETKLLQTQPFNESTPTAIQTAAIAYYWSGVMQSIPSGWDTSLHNLAGIVTTQGLGGFNRIGDYVYYKKTHLALQVDVNETSDFTAPVEFRFIIAKARQANTPAGVTDTPQTSLFLSNLGAPTGHAVSGVNGADLMLQPLNKRDWVIHRDQKFTLTTPTTGGGGMNFYYKSRKNLFVDLKYFAKTRVHPTTNQPEDLDAHYLVYLYASAIGKDRKADNWEVSVRGTTSFTDN